MDGDDAPTLEFLIPVLTGPVLYRIFWLPPANAQ